MKRGINYTSFTLFTQKLKKDTGHLCVAAIGLTVCKTMMHTRMTGKCYRPLYMLKGISAEFQVIRGFSQKIPADLLSYDKIHS